jgi:Haem-binding domain
MKVKQILGILGVVIVASLLILTAQATAKNRSNPPVIDEPQWDSPETRQLAQRACFDCHSNQTKWPVYSVLPVVGGLIEKHVIDARKELNFSEWGTGREQEAEEASEKVFDPMHYAEEDSLPQPPYSWFHPEARLTQAEREQLAQGLTATFGGEGRGETGEQDENEQSENEQEDD